MEKVIKRCFLFQMCIVVEWKDADDYRSVRIRGSPNRNHESIWCIKQTIKYIIQFNLIWLTQDAVFIRPYDCTEPHQLCWVVINLWSKFISHSYLVRVKLLTMCAAWGHHRQSSPMTKPTNYGGNFLRSSQRSADNLFTSKFPFRWVCIFCRNFFYSLSFLWKINYSR